MPSATAESPDLSPENRPVTNLLMAGVVTLSIGLSLYQLGDVSPALVAAGFAATAVAFGPVGSSVPGKRFGEWFRDIGGAARVGLMLALGTGIVAVTVASDVPLVWVQSALFGSTVALDGYVVYRIASHRDSS